MSALALLAAWALVFAMNLMPAFMPPTWAVLAVLHFSLDVPVLPLALGGAVAASLGRLALGLVSRRFGIRLVPNRRRADLRRLGTWLDAKARWAAPLAVLVYSFGPIPSNQLFVAAGLTGMSLRRIAGAFLAGRLLSYPLWIGVAHLAASRLDDLFTQRWHDARAIAVDLALLGILSLFALVDWSRVIARIDPGFGLPAHDSDRAHRPTASVTFDPPAPPPAA